MLCALRSDRRSSLYRQRRLVAVSILLPLWVWLVAAFPYHALGISNLSKIWQIELPVVLFILVFFLYHAFREGIWGMRLRRETYDWSGSRGEVLQRNTQYVAHALKNDLNKIDWCTALLDEQMPGSAKSISSAIRSNTCARSSAAQKRTPTASRWNPISATCARCLSSSSTKPRTLLR
ncbi:MAG: hypothetical protein ACLUMK_11160 [Christensenellales bacterium]